MFVCRLYLLLFIMFLNSCSQSLPLGYKLEKNQSGELHLVNPEGDEVVEPKILSYGFDKNNFVACVKPNDEFIVDNLRKIADKKRFQAVNFNSGMAVHLLNKKQWEDFVKSVPDVGKVKLKQLSDETCP